MTIILKIGICAIVAAICTLVVKQVKPEYAALIELSGIAVICLVVLSLTDDLLKLSVFEMFSGISSQGSDFLKLLIKVLGVSVAAEITSDICRDSGSNALANNVELAAKLIMLVMIAPLLKSLLDIAAGLINGA